MSPLEKLFRLEIDFHCRLRTLAPHEPDTGGVHTSYALQSGYEPLLRQLGRVTNQDIELLRHRLTPSADARDITAAGDSLKELLHIPQPQRFTRADAPASAIRSPRVR
jgi:hypothetical protein